MADGRKIPYIIEMIADDTTLRNQMKKWDWEDIMGAKGAKFADILGQEGKEAKERIKKELGGLNIDWEKIFGSKTQMQQFEQSLARVLTKSHKALSALADDDADGLQKIMDYVTGLGEAFKSFGSNFKVDALSRNMGAFMKVFSSDKISKMTANIDEFSNSLDRVFGKNITRSATQTGEAVNKIAKALVTLGTDKSAIKNIQDIKVALEKAVQNTKIQLEIDYDKLDNAAIEKKLREKLKISADDTIDLEGLLTQEWDNQLIALEETQKHLRTLTGDQAKYATESAKLIPILNTILSLGKKAEQLTGYSWLEGYAVGDFADERAIKEEVEDLVKMLNEELRKSKRQIQKATEQLMSGLGTVNIKLSLDDADKTSFEKHINDYIAKLNSTTNIDDVKIGVSVKDEGGLSDDEIKDRISKAKEWRQEVAAALNKDKEKVSVYFGVQAITDGLHQQIQEYFEDNEIDLHINKEAFVKEIQAALASSGVSGTSINLAGGTVDINPETLAKAVAAGMQAFFTGDFTALSTGKPKSEETPQKKPQKTFYLDPNNDYNKEVVALFKEVIKYAQGNKNPNKQVRDFLTGKLVGTQYWDDDKKAVNFDGMLASIDPSDMVDVLSHIVEKYGSTLVDELGTLAKDAKSQLIKNFRGEMAELIGTHNFKQTTMDESLKAQKRQVMWEDYSKKARFTSSLGALMGASNSKVDELQLPKVSDIDALIEYVKENTVTKEDVDAIEAKFAEQWSALDQANKNFKQKDLDDVSEQVKEKQYQVNAANAKKDVEQVKVLQAELDTLKAREQELKDAREAQRKASNDFEKIKRQRDRTVGNYNLYIGALEQLEAFKVALDEEITDASDYAQRQKFLDRVKGFANGVRGVFRNITNELKQYEWGIEVEGFDSIFEIDKPGKIKRFDRATQGNKERKITPHLYKAPASSSKLAEDRPDRTDVLRKEVVVKKFRTRELIDKEISEAEALLQEAENNNDEAKIAQQRARIFGLRTERDTLPTTSKRWEEENFADKNVAKKEQEAQKNANEYYSTFPSHFGKYVQGESDKQVLESAIAEREKHIEETEEYIKENSTDKRKLAGALKRLENREQAFQSAEEEYHQLEQAALEATEEYQDAKKNLEHIQKGKYKDIDYLDGQIVKLEAQQKNPLKYRKDLQGTITTGSDGVNRMEGGIYQNAYNNARYYRDASKQNAKNAKLQYEALEKEEQRIRAFMNKATNEGDIDELNRLEKELTNTRRKIVQYKETEQKELQAYENYQAELVEILRRRNGTSKADKADFAKDAKEYIKQHLANVKARRAQLGADPRVEAQARVDRAEHNAQITTAQANKAKTEMDKAQKELEQVQQEEIVQKALAIEEQKNNLRTMKETNERQKKEIEEIEADEENARNNTIKKKLDQTKSDIDTLSKEVDSLQEQVRQSQAEANQIDKFVNDTIEDKNYKKPTYDIDYNEADREVVNKRGNYIARSVYLSQVAEGNLGRDSVMPKDLTAAMSQMVQSIFDSREVVEALSGDFGLDKFDAEKDIKTDIQRILDAEATSKNKLSPVVKEYYAKIVSDGGIAATEWLQQNHPEIEDTIKAEIQRRLDLAESGQLTLSATVRDYYQQIVSNGDNAASEWLKATQKENEAAMKTEVQKRLDNASSGKVQLHSTIVDYYQKIINEGFGATQWLEATKLNAITNIEQQKALLEAASVDDDIAASALDSQFEEAESRLKTTYQARVSKWFDEIRSKLKVVGTGKGRNANAEAQQAGALAAKEIEELLKLIDSAAGNYIRFTSDAYKEQIRVLDKESKMLDVQLKTGKISQAAYEHAIKEVNDKKKAAEGAERIRQREELFGDNAKIYDQRSKFAYTSYRDRSVNKATASLAKTREQIKDSERYNLLLGRQAELLREISESRKDATKVGELESELSTINEEVSQYQMASVNISEYLELKKKEAETSRQIARMYAENKKESEIKSMEDNLGQISRQLDTYKNYEAQIKHTQTLSLFDGDVELVDKYKASVKEIIKLEQEVMLARAQGESETQVGERKAAINAKRQELENFVYAELQKKQESLLDSIKNNTEEAKQVATTIDTLKQNKASKEEINKQKRRQDELEKAAKLSTQQLEAVNLELVELEMNKRRVAQLEMGHMLYKADVDTVKEYNRLIRELIDLEQEKALLVAQGRETSDVDKRLRKHRPKVAREVNRMTDARIQRDSALNPNAWALKYIQESQKEYDLALQQRYAVVGRTKRAQHRKAMVEDDENYSRSGQYIWHQRAVKDMITNEYIHSDKYKVDRKAGEDRAAQETFEEVEKIVRARIENAYREGGKNLDDADIQAEINKLVKEQADAVMYRFKVSLGKDGMKIDPKKMDEAYQLFSQGGWEGIRESLEAGFEDSAEYKSLITERNRVRQEALTKEIERIEEEGNSVIQTIQSAMPEEYEPLRKEMSKYVTGADVGLIEREFKDILKGTGKKTNINKIKSKLLDAARRFGASKTELDDLYGAITENVSNIRHGKQSDAIASILRVFQTDKEFALDKARSSLIDKQQKLMMRRSVGLSGKHAEGKFRADTETEKQFRDRLNDAMTLYVNKALAPENIGEIFKDVDLGDSKIAKDIVETFKNKMESYVYNLVRDYAESLEVEDGIIENEFAQNAEERIIDIRQQVIDRIDGELAQLEKDGVLAEQNIAALEAERKAAMEYGGVKYGDVIDAEVIREQSILKARLNLEKEYQAELSAAIDKMREDGASSEELGILGEELEKTTNKINRLQHLIDNDDILLELMHEERTNAEASKKRTPEELKMLYEAKILAAESRLNSDNATVRQTAQDDITRYSALLADLEAKMEAQAAKEREKNDPMNIIANKFADAIKKSLGGNGGLNVDATGLATEATLTQIYEILVGIVQAMGGKVIRDPEKDAMLAELRALKAKKATAVASENKGGNKATATNDNTKNKNANTQAEKNPIAEEIIDRIKKEVKAKTDAELEQLIKDLVGKIKPENKGTKEDTEARFALHRAFNEYQSRHKNENAIPNVETYKSKDNTLHSYKVLAKHLGVEGADQLRYTQADVTEAANKNFAKAEATATQESEKQLKNEREATAESAKRVENEKKATENDKASNNQNTGIRQISIEEAKSIIQSKVSKDLIDNWYIKRDPAARNQLGELAMSDEELRNATLNLLWYHVSDKLGANMPNFDNFVNNQTKLFRGTAATSVVEPDWDDDGNLIEDRYQVLYGEDEDKFKSATLSSRVASAFANNYEHIHSQEMDSYGGTTFGVIMQITDQLRNMVGLFADVYNELEVIVPPGKFPTTYDGITSLEPDGEITQYEHLLNGAELVASTKHKDVSRSEIYKNIEESISNWKTTKLSGASSEDIATDIEWLIKNLRYMESDDQLEVEQRRTIGVAISEFAKKQGIKKGDKFLKNIKEDLSDYGVFLDEGHLKQGIMTPGDLSKALVERDLVIPQIEPGAVAEEVKENTEQTPVIAEVKPEVAKEDANAYVAKLQEILGGVSGDTKGTENQLKAVSESMGRLKKAKGVEAFNEFKESLLALQSGKGSIEDATQKAQKFVDTFANYKSNTFSDLSKWFGKDVQADATTLLGIVKQIFEVTSKEQIARKAARKAEEVKPAQQVAEAAQAEAAATAQVTEEKAEQKAIESSYTTEDARRERELTQKLGGYTGPQVDFSEADIGLATEETLKAILNLVTKIQTEGIKKSGTGSKKKTVTKADEAELIKRRALLNHEAILGLGVSDSSTMATYNELIAQLEKKVKEVQDNAKAKKSTAEPLKEVKVLAQKISAMGFNIMKEASAWDYTVKEADKVGTVDPYSDVRTQMEALAQKDLNGKQYKFLNFDGKNLAYQLADIDGNVEKVTMSWSELNNQVAITSDKSVAKLDELAGKVKTFEDKFKNAIDMGYLADNDEVLERFKKKVEDIAKATTFDEKAIARNEALQVADEVTKKINANKKLYAGTTEMNAATRQYGNLETSGILDQEDLQLVKDYKAQYAEIAKIQDEWRAKDNGKGLLNPEAQKQLRQASLGAKNLGRELEKAVNNTQRLNQLVENSGSFNGKNIGDISQLQQGVDVYDAMRTKLEELGATNIKVDRIHQTATGTIRHNNRLVSDLTVEYDELTGSLARYQKQERESLTGLPAFLNGFQKKFNSIMQYLSMTMSIHQVMAQLRKGVQYIREINLALTELKKVTDETEETYDRFLETAAKTGARLGTTISAVTEATATFAKLGYTMEQSTEMAEAAIVYKNVGDNIASTGDAADSIISTMKGFGLEASESMAIVDKFNEVGNRFAITSQGIGEALRVSASALNEGKNSLDESIGLITAANEVVNDPSSVGTALKTLTLRLRGSKTELEEMGEDVSDMATTTSQLQAKLLALTGGKVDIMLDANTFKNSTQILREMADAWEDMDDISRASALELMGGKRQAKRTNCLNVQKCA